MNDSRMLGILWDVFLAAAGAAWGWPVWKEAAIWVKPVGCGTWVGADAGAGAEGGGATGFA